MLFLRLFFPAFLGSAIPDVEDDDDDDDGGGGGGGEDFVVGISSNLAVNMLTPTTSSAEIASTDSLAYVTRNAECVSSSILKVDELTVGDVPVESCSTCTSVNGSKVVSLERSSASGLPSEIIE